MAGRQRYELSRPSVEEVTIADQDGTNTLLGKSCERRFEIAIGAGIHDNELQGQRARRRLKVCDGGLGSRGDWFREDAEPGSMGYQLVEQLQLFRPQLDR